MHGELKTFNNADTWHVFHILYGWLDTGYSKTLPMWLVEAKMRESARKRVAS